MKNKESKVQYILLAIILIASILSLSSIVIAASEASNDDMNIIARTSVPNHPPGVWDTEFAEETMQTVADWHGWTTISTGGGGGRILALNSAGNWFEIGRFETKRWNNSIWHHFHITHPAWSDFNGGRGNVHWIVSGW